MNIVWTKALEYSLEGEVVMYDAAVVQSCDEHTYTAIVIQHIHESNGSDYHTSCCKSGFVTIEEAVRWISNSSMDLDEYREVRNV